MKILIVDDSASMRSLLSSLLASHGHDVVGALEDGSRIMQCIAESSPELVCLDYELPGRNGLQLLNDINTSAPHVDVVMMTSSTDPEIRHRAADAGAAGFIQKPFGQSQIIEELEQVHSTRAHATQANAPADAVTAERVSSAAGSGHEQAAVKATVPSFDPATTVIADDNGSIRYLLQGLLTELGFKVVHLANNGQDAVTAAEVHRPGVLCLDVDMPVMSGLDALPLIREKSPHTKVVMVTGNATRGLVEKALTGGARGYIVKPLRPAYVEAFMRKLLPPENRTD